jgi:DNA-binding MarR family transcriptional regulator
MTGESSQIELAKLVGLDKTTMVVTLDDLERAGLAERRPSATDRRARIIAVTPEGERVVAAAKAVAERLHADVLASLPAGERDGFLDALRRLATDRLAEPVACAQPVRRRATG